MPTKSVTIKNPCRKERKVYKGETPYATWVDRRTGWRYELLKSWQGDNSKPYARWFCRVHGFCTEMGDCYVDELRGGLPSYEEITVDETVFPTVGAFVAWAYGEF